MKRQRIRFEEVRTVDGQMLQPELTSPLLQDFGGHVRYSRLTLAWRPQGPQGPVLKEHRQSHLDSGCAHACGGAIRTATATNSIRVDRRL